LLGWARRRFDVDFVTTSGVSHIAQPAATVERLAHAVAALDAFQLAGLSPLVTIGGSLIAGLAVLDKAMTADEAWEAVSLDERWQLEQWGRDAEAEAALDDRRRDFMAAARFLQLLET
jgi:chaperone required for assembly of F1-ATPase